ncbi:MAG TPA: class I SAM-dependent methyltransferase family protein [Methanomassiliicoccales archaeon]|nr:class I SAM-dependent methyltransferase family protein [Methanomassiliicoccales archaeon]
MPKSKGESVRKILLERGLLDVSLRVRRDGDDVLFPVMSEAATETGFPLCDDEFEERRAAETDYSLLAEVPEELRDSLPTSFDVIGDVAIIKLPDELLPFSQKVGEALMRTFPRLRTVALDRGVKGELRVRELEVIAGDANLETSHTEYGVHLLVDPSKVYFNPRLSNERMRVASLVRRGEVVLDMFSGVGPFAIMIAKRAKPKVVYAIDLNPDAVTYLRRNIEANKADKVVAFEGNAREVIFDLPNLDRIVMNLPHSAIDFFADALTKLNFGGTIHLYHICDRDDIEQIVEKLVISARGMGVDIEVTRQEELKTYSPSMSVFALDLVLHKWS